MTLLRHELRQGRKALTVWTACIGMLIAVCILLYPDIKGEMEGMSQLFATMGAFSAAFGMDRLNFGTLTGFYAVECGNILGLGGAFFAALTGISALAGEERNHTAEFLLTHPVSRSRVVLEKLLAVLVQVLAMNIAIYALSIVSVALIGEAVPWRELSLLHLAHLLLQLEVACVCFGLSAFLRTGGAGLGLGLAVGLYFLNLVANLTESARFLRYITPFAYSDGAELLTRGALDMTLVLPGVAYAAAALAAAFCHYSRKDIH